MEKKLTLKSIKKRSSTVKPVAMDLASKEASRIIRSATKRVMKTHDKVIKALANR